MNYEPLSPTMVVPVGGIKRLQFDGTKLFILGYAYYEGELDKNRNHIEHTVIVRRLAAKGIETNVDNQGDMSEIEFEIPSEIVFETTGLKVSGVTGIHSDYHYEVTLDFSTLLDGKPLPDGEYELNVRLRQFIDGVWRAYEFAVGSIEDLDGNFVHTTKVRRYAEKTVTTYSLVTSQLAGQKSVAIKSTKLSEMNPADLIVRDEVIEAESRAKTMFKKGLFRLAYVANKLMPIKKNRVSFLSDSRIDLTGNFEYIYEEMQKRENQFDTRFYLKQTNSEPKTLGEYLTLANAIATSRYVLLDDFYPLIYPLSIRNGVDLIQVWHAVGAFKTFGFSRVGMAGGPSLKSKNHRNYTKALVSSTSVVSNYAEGFGIDQNRVLPLGAPRTDLFFDEEKKQSTIEKLYEQLPFLKDKKVILFAPTFRGPGQQTAYYPFDWLDYQALYDEFANQGYIFLFKIHPFVKNSPAIPYEYSDFFYDVSDYREINDLLLLTDALITDYSSVVFEYSLLKRKTIFFAPDLSEYMTSRNFYVDYLDFIPGPYVGDTKHLIDEIKLADDIDEARLEAFLNYYFDDLDGKAAVRFVDALEDNFGEVDSELVDGEPEFTEDGKWIPNWGK
ncbi:CDP-glycerol glycerophosphotransferase family protein [Weissella sp. GP1]|uniref:CDP-glycerol glycerophosphotransferase family protein n=1 Tax=Weissella confusa TaxID=1583 RepID=UPI0032DBE5A2